MSVKMAPTMDDVSRHPKRYFQYPPFIRKSKEKSPSEKLEIYLFIVLNIRASSSDFTLTSGKQTKNGLRTDFTEKVSDLCSKTYHCVTLGACPL